MRGFSVVDPGGNWLRVSKLGDDERAEDKTSGLARVIENAARIGDAKGDEEEAIRLLSNGLERFSDAPPVERARALLYLAELNARIGRESAALELLSEAHRSISRTTTASRSKPRPTTPTKSWVKVSMTPTRVYG